MSAAEPVEADLPKALLKRLITSKLQEVDRTRGGDGTRSFQVNKDALLAFGEAAKLFIHYLTAAANDNCKDAKRQTISADDVLTALNDLDFGEFADPLKAELEAFKVENREKNKKKAEAGGKKRKPVAAGGGGAEGEEAAAGEEDGGGDGGDEKRQRGEEEEAPAE
jgi:DNA polymerase epsilon subunit 3